MDYLPVGPKLFVSEYSFMKTVKKNLSPRIANWCLARYRECLTKGAKSASVIVSRMHA